MYDSVKYMISLFLSILLFDFLFYKLNCRFNLFEPIRNKINNLNEENKNSRKLRIISYILVAIILMIIPVNITSSMTYGCTFGLLLSFRNMCFKDTFIESINQDNK
ncbi:MAG: hypothetical protein Q3980_06140 [Turicibacter sp.]|nr:hypothetical protein [Turicibacter sp.]